MKNQEKNVTVMTNDWISTVKTNYGNSELAFKKMAKKVADGYRFFVMSGRAYQAIISDDNYSYDCYTGEVHHKNW